MGRRVPRLQHASRHPYLLVPGNPSQPRVTTVLILLPPSEGKATPRRGAPLDLARLSARRAHARARAGARRPWSQLCRDDPERAMQVLGLGPTQADDVRRNADLLDRTDRAGRRDVHGRALRVPRPRLPRRRRAPSRVTLDRGHLVGLRAGATGRPDPVVPPRRRGQPPRPRRRLRPLARRPRARRARGSRHAASSSTSGPRTYAAFWRPEPELARKVATVRVLHEVGGRSGPWSATSTRPPRAAWSVPSSSSGATPSTPAAPRRPDHRPRLEGRARRPRQARPAARRGRGGALGLDSPA